MFAGEAIDEILRYSYFQVIQSINDFTTSMSEVGLSMFDDPNVKGVLNFFQMFAWALWLIGSVLSIMEFVIAYQEGSAPFRGTGMSLLKSFIAVNLFVITPILLYNFTVDIYGSISAVMTAEAAGSRPTTATYITAFFGGILDAGFNLGMSMSGNVPDVNVWDFLSMTQGTQLPIHALISMFIMVYVVIKVFIGNLKRGGILLIMIGTGSLHMLSLPRGYSDGFSAWCKQTVAVCFTVFLQNVLFTLALMMTSNTQATYIMLGVALAAAEVPRIAQMFGFDTSAKANIGGAFHTASSAFTMIKTIAR